MTQEERKLWFEFLKDYPIRVNRQKVFGQYIADFYCAKAKLIIELDGTQHFEKKGHEYDEKRDEYLENLGLTVIRIPNNYIHENFDGVCEYLDLLIQQKIQTR